MSKLLDRLSRLVCKYGDMCWYCGKKRWQEVEHCTPRSRGGADDDANCVLACRGCNVIKSNRTVEEFRALVARRIGVERVSFFGESGVPIRIPLSSALAEQQRAVREIVRSMQER